jgi:integrase
MPARALTSAFVQALSPPPSGITEYWDTKVAGLCLRVFSTGRASWSFRYRPRNGGARQRITLGSLADLSLAAARDRAARLRIEVADGADPQRDRQEKRVAARNVLTFTVLADRYVELYAKRKKASWRNDVLYLKRPRAAWGHMPVEEITRRWIMMLLDEIATTAPVSANRTHTVLSKLFSWAVESEMAAANPIAGLRKRAAETPKERTLTDAEIAVLWPALDRAGLTIDLADALRLILLTGQRPGEVAGMQRAEIVAPESASQARWELPAERTKARRPHVVPLAPSALSVVNTALKRRRTDGDERAVLASRFTGRDGIARHSLSQGLKRVIQRLDPALDPDAVRSLREGPPTPHDLRRTLATGLARLGIPREDRLAVLGHVADDVHGKHYDKYARLREKRIALGARQRGRRAHHEGGAMSKGDTAGPLDDDDDDDWPESDPLFTKLEAHRPELVELFGLETEEQYWFLVSGVIAAVHQFASMKEEAEQALKAEDRKQELTQTAAAARQLADLLRRDRAWSWQFGIPLGGARAPDYQGEVAHLAGNLERLVVKIRHLVPVLNGR